MASVKKFKDSAIWYACYRRADGKRMQRSTGTEDRDEALSIALAYERASKLAIRGQFVQASANRFLAEIAAITGAQLGLVEPAKDFLSRWAAVRCKGVGKSRGATTELAVRRFLAFLGAKAAGPLSDIGPSTIAGFRDALVASGMALSTSNLLLGVLRAAFAEAVANGALPTNPAAAVRAVGSGRGRTRRKAFTLEQFKALVAVAEGEWKTLILICGLTGARRSEASALTWEQYDEARGVIRLARTKSGDDHLTPVHPWLAEHLRTLKRTEGLIMPGIAAKDPTTISGFFRVSILPKIGIKQEYTKGGEGRQLAAYSLHSLRHSLASWLAEAGVEERLRMLLIGHEDRRVARGYTHSRFTELAAALGKVGASRPNN